MSKTIALVSILFLRICCSGQVNNDVFGHVERTSIPTTIYASTNSSISLIRIMGLTLEYPRIAVHFVVYAEKPIEKVCDSIKIICANKNELILNKLSSNYSDGQYGALSEFSIDYLIEADQTTKLSNSTITGLIFYFGKDHRQVSLLPDQTYYLKACLCSCE